VPHKPFGILVLAKTTISMEITNGLLKEFFPKGFDFADFSQEHIQQKMDVLNRRTRKCLGFKTPYQVYYDTVLHLV